MLKAQCNNAEYAVRACCGMISRIVPIFSIPTVIARMAYARNSICSATIFLLCCTPAISCNKQDADCKLSGVLGDYKVAIPQKYIYGPGFVYKGQNIWQYRKDNMGLETDTLNKKIDYIEILVRLSDFRPIENHDDQTDFTKFYSSNIYKRSSNDKWVVISFRQGSGTSLLYKFRNLENDAYKSRFVDKDTFFHLEHYISSDPPSTKTGVEEINEIFFDKVSLNTIIYCANFLERREPFREVSNCHHEFRINESIDAKINMIDDKLDYIGNWNTYEDKIRSIFKGFIVR